jgi:hypothetical protein
MPGMYSKFMEFLCEWSHMDTKLLKPATKEIRKYLTSTAKLAYFENIEAGTIYQFIFYKSRKT